MRNKKLIIDELRRENAELRARIAELERRIGVTGDLKQRMNEHKNGTVEGFTQKYDVKNLVYSANI